MNAILKLFIFSYFYYGQKKLQKSKFKNSDTQSENKSWTMEWSQSWAFRIHIAKIRACTFVWPPIRLVRYATFARAYQPDKLN